MAVETISNKLEGLSEVPKIEIREAENPAEILDLVKKRVNFLSNSQEMDNFFNREENQKADQLIFTASCERRTISEIREKVLDFLTKRGIIGQEESADFQTLIGEVIRDTLHSIKQGFTDPKFSVRIFHLNDPQKFSFEIINPDRILCREWPRFSPGEVIEKISASWGTGESLGLGGKLLESTAKDLRARIWYSDIKNEKGEKEYTLFHFERAAGSGD